MPFQNYVLSVRVVGVTDELVSICEGIRPALNVEIAVHSETLVPICKTTSRHVCEDGNLATGVACWVVIAFQCRIIMSSLTGCSHSETESRSIPDERFVLV